MRFHVERLLPSSVLLNLGIYLQTCAHIELAAWQIVLELNGFPVNRGLVSSDMIETKLKTWELLKELKSCGSKAPLKLATRIHKLAADIKDGLPYRNAAAHGAFFYELATDQLRAAHFSAEGKPSERIYRSVEDAISPNTISNAMEEADRILAEAIAIKDALTDTPKRPKPLPPTPPLQGSSTPP